MANAEIKVVGRGDFSQFERSISAARRKAETESASIQKSFSRVSANSLQSLSGLAGGLVGAAAIKNAVGLADAYTNMNARLSLVTNGTEDFARVQAELVKLAQDTRAPLAETVDLYTRISRATKELGVEQQTVAQVTANISKALVISGADAQSAQAALVQLGQGFASGALRGEELNSVLEQTPRLAEAIAAGLGVSVGQLRELGKEGKLTAEAVIGSLISQTAALDAEFKRMPVTAAQGLQAVRDSLGLLIGRLDTAVGFTQRLAGGFQALAKLAENPAGVGSRLLGTDDIGKLEADGRKVQNAIDLTIKQIERWQALSANGNPKAIAEVDRYRESLVPLNAQLRAINEQLLQIARGPAAPQVSADTGDSIIRRRAKDIETAQKEFAALEKLTPAEKTKAKIEEIKRLGREANATQAEIARAVAAATPKATGESAFVRIQKEIGDLRIELAKVDLGKTESILLDLERKGATSAQVKAAQGILDQIEARKTLRDLEEDQLGFAAARAKEIEDEAKKRQEVTRSITDQVEQQRLEVATIGQSSAERRTAVTMLEAERAGVKANTAEWFRLRDAVLASNKAYDDATRLQDLIGNTESARIAAATADIKLLTEALQEYIATGGQSGIDQSTYLEAVEARLGLVKEKTEEAKDVAKEFGLTFSSALEDAVFSGKKLSDVVKALAIDIAKAFFRKTVTESVLGFVSSATSGASSAPALQELGGYVPRATITPSSVKASSVSSSPTIYQTVEINAPTDQISDWQLKRMVYEGSLQASRDSMQRSGRL